MDRGLKYYFKHQLCCKTAEKEYCHQVIEEVRAIIRCKDAKDACYLGLMNNLVISIISSTTQVKLSQTPEKLLLCFCIYICCKKDPKIRKPECQLVFHLMTRRLPTVNILESLERCLMDVNLSYKRLVWCSQKV